MASADAEPQGTLVLIHTVAPLIDEFAELCRDVLPGVQTFHILDEPLLERIRLRGGDGPEDERRLASHIELAESIGGDAVLVTCSTTSLLADVVRAAFAIPVVTIDEAMAVEVIRSGPRVALVATNETTLEPSRTRILAEAARTGSPVELTACVVPNALTALLQGDAAAHDRLVEHAIWKAAEHADVVVLAQASMARVIRALTLRQLGVPLLSSPELALRQVGHLLADRIRQRASAVGTGR